MYPMPRLVFFLYYILNTMKFIFLSLKVFCFYTLNISDIITLSIPENSLRATKAQLHIFCLYVIFFLQKLQTSDPCNVDPCKQSIYVVKGRSRPCSRQLTFLLSSIRVLSTISLIFSFERLSALKTGLKRSVR